MDSPVFKHGHRNIGHAILFAYIIYIHATITDTATDKCFSGKNLIHFYFLYLQI